jgi:hypothetical protein
MRLFKPAMGMVFSALCITGLCRPANASLVVWGNGAGHGTNHLQAFDLETGDKLRDFSGPNPDARGFFGGDAGRGIAVAGNTVYYTSSGSGKLFMADADSFADEGFLFDTGLTGLRSVAFDGSTFWIRDDFSNQLRRYTAGGTLLSILPDFTSSFDVYGDRILARDSGFMIWAGWR